MKDKQVVIKMQNTKLKFNYLTALGACMLSRLSTVDFALTANFPNRAEDVATYNQTPTQSIYVYI